MPRFILNGFDDQERNLTYCENKFPRFSNSIFMPAILSSPSILFLNYCIIAWPWQIKNTLHKLFVRYLVVKPACINAAYMCFKMLHFYWKI